MNAFFSSLLLLLFALPAIGRAGTVDYTASTADIPNPERGWYVTMYSYGNGISQNNTLNDASWQGQVTGSGNATGDTNQTLIKRIYDLGGIYGGTDYANAGANGLDTTWLSNLTTDLNTARSLGVKLIPRFDYNEDTVGNSGNDGGQDAPLATILGNISQITSIIQANEDVIAYWEAGFIGQWGEWHDSTNGLTDTNNANIVSAETSVLDAVLTMLPTDRMVAVRYPGYTMEIFNTTAPITTANAFNGSNYSRCGTHDDCFESDEYDGGTYQKGTNEGLSVAQFKSYLGSQNYSVAEGGETCGTSSYSTCATSVADLQSEHWSAMHCEWDPANIDAWSSGGCLSEINTGLGYRYSLTQSTVPTTVNANGTLSMTFTVANNGWANCYNQRGLEVILRQTGQTGFNTAVAIPVVESTANNTDPRYWQPGNTYTANISVTLPSTIAAGTYNVLLNLPDGHSSLYNSAANPTAYIKYAIQLANTGTWESADGYNNLNQTLTVVNCAGCTATPTPLPTNTPVPGSGTVISIDFVGGSTNGDPPSMATSEVAGVKAEPYWNDATSFSGTLAGLVDNEDGATGASLTYSAGNGIWSLPITYSAGNYDMMGGYIDAQTADNTTVQVSGLPSRITASGYEVYVYFDGDNGTASRTGNYTIGATTISGTDAANANFSGTFTQAAGGSNGNYVLFTGQTAASFTLTAAVGASTDAYPRAPINGIQIVANPSTGTPTSSPSPTRTASPSSTPTKTVSPSSTTTISPTKTASPSATVSPLATPTDTPTRTVSPSSTATNSPTKTVSPSATATNSSTLTATPTKTASPSATPSPSASSSSTLTRTGTPSSTVSPSTTLTATPTPSASSSSTLTRTGTPSSTVSPSTTLTATPSPSASSSSTLTRTGTPSSTVSPSSTLTATPTPSASSSSTLTRTGTPSATVSPSITATTTPSPSAGSSSTLTRTGTPSATASPSATLTATPTPSASSSSTLTRTDTPSSTMSPSTTLTRTTSPSATVSPSFTVTLTPNLSSTPTESSTLSPTPTLTRTGTPSSTASPSTTVTATPTPSASPSSTLTRTGSPSPTASPSITATTTPSPSASASSTLTGTGSPSPTVSPSATTTGTASPSATVSPSFTVTLTPNLSSTPTESSTLSPTPTLTRTGTPSATVSPSPTVTATLSPSASPSITATATLSPSASPSSTPTRTNTPSLTVSPSSTLTATPSLSLTPTGSPTSSPTYTLTATPSQSPSPSPSLTLTATPSQSPSPSPSVTLTTTPSQSPSPSPSVTLTATPSQSPSPSPSVTLTASPTGSITASPTPTRTSSPSPSVSATPTFSNTPRATVTATTDATATPVPGPGGIIKAVPWPNPNPRQIAVDLSGLSPLTLRLYTKSLYLVAQVSIPTQGPGWVSIALPSPFLTQMANGTYYYRVTDGSPSDRGVVGRLVILR